MKSQHFKIRFKCISIAIFLVINAIPAAIVFAHPDQPIAPHDLWSAWNINIVLILMLEVMAFIYLRGVQMVWQSAGWGRGIAVWRCVAFCGFIVMLVLALISPLDALSTTLLSAHMVQHTVLILFVPLLLILSDFPIAVLWALSRRNARAVAHQWQHIYILRCTARFLRNPFVAWSIFTVTIWLWHTPLLYEAALLNEPIHLTEHIMFLASALLFWWLLSDAYRPKYVRYGIAIPYLFTTSLHTGILGALMTFAERPWYSFYAQTTALWGVSPLQDQQLAGLIMWVLHGTIFMLLFILYFGMWLRALDQHTAHKRIYVQ
jgi:putative membrane protein